MTISDIYLNMLQDEGGGKIRVLREGRLRRRSGNGFEGEGAEREPLGPVQKKISVGLAG